MARKHQSEKVAGSYAVIPHAVMDSAAFMGASHHARSLLFELMRQHNGKNNGHFQLSRKWLSKRGWNSAAIYQHAKTELLERHLTVKTRLGGLNAGPDLWGVTWLPISDYSKLTEVTANTYHPGAWHFMDKAIPLAVKHSREASFERSTGRNSAEPPGGTVTAFTEPPGGTVSAVIAHVTEPPGGNNVVTSSHGRKVARRIVGRKRSAIPTVANSETAENVPEQVIAFWNEEGEGKAKETAPVTAIEVADASDVCRLPDEVPSEYWDSDIGEFRPIPQQKRRTTVLVREWEQEHD